MPPSPLRQRWAHLVSTFRAHLLGGFSWNLLSTIALQGSVLLSSVLVARLLGVREFGLYALALTTVLTLAGIVQGGTGVVATRFVGEFLAQDPARVHRVLRLCRLATRTAGGCAALALMAGAPWLASTVLGNAEVGPPLRWAALAVFFHAVVAYQQGALMGFGAFERMGRASAGAGLAHLLCTVGGAWWAGLTGATVGLVLAAAARAAWLAWALGHAQRVLPATPPTPVQPQDWQLLWHFGLPAALSGMVTLACLWGATAVLARQPLGVEWVAIFSAAQQVRLTLLQLPTLLNTVAFSALSRLQGQRDALAFRAVLRTNTAVGLGFTFLVTLIALPLSAGLLGLYGPGFARGDTMALLLLLSMVPEAFAAARYQMVQAAGRMWQSLRFIVLPRDLGYLALAALCVPRFGLTGAGAAYLAAQIIGALCTHALASHASRQPTSHERHH